MYELSSTPTWFMFCRTCRKSAGLQSAVLFCYVKMVVMPEYLMTPSKQNPSKPRIISEVKKNCFSKLKLSFTTSLQDFGKSKFSGQLLWNTGNSDWVLTTADVRQGSLILINRETSAVVLRQALRELNLRACNAPRTFCLTESEGVRLLLFQALSDEEYEKWVRILAAELIRQTPLHNVRFLDILSILRNKEPDKSNLKKGKSEECIAKPKCNGWVSKSSRSDMKEETIEEAKPKKREETQIESDDKSKKIKVRYQKSVPLVPERERRHKIWLRTQSMNNLVNMTETATKLTSDESGISSGDENQPETNPRDVENFSFLSVKERKNFFESLNSELETKGRETSPLMRSNSISNFKQATNFIPERNKLCRRKRTKSLHDLHKTPVKEMCQLFESQERKDDQNTQIGYDRIIQRRLQRREKKLEKLSNQIDEVEESIKIVTEDIKSIGPNTLKRKEGLEVFAGLKKRLEEEHAKLARLKDEMARIIKGSQRSILKMESSSVKRY